MQDLMEPINDDWKKDLREKFIAAFLNDGNIDDKQYEDIGYYYTCYAPKYLYKYFGDYNKAFEVIEKEQMWYSAPHKFNDVFDSYTTVDEKALFESFLKLVPDKRGMRAGSYAWNQLKAEVHNQCKLFNAEFDKIRKTTGVSCFSEQDNSLLMWAHYANNHMGMCAEYDLLGINKQLGFTPVPVIYDSKRVCFNRYNEDNINEYVVNVFIKSLTTKSPEWSYEKEWRIIRDEGACGEKWNTEKEGALLEMIRPHSIILGCMADQSFENEVKAFCDSNRINLYKMNKDDLTYGLTKEVVLQFDD